MAETTNEAGTEVGITSGGYTLTCHDPKADTDDDVAERVAFSNAIKEEATPGEPPTPVADAIAALRASPERMRRWSYRARDGSGELAAMGGTGFDPEHDDNPDVLFVNIAVAAAHRRRGLGLRLLASLVELAEAEGRNRLISSTSDRLPAGEAFAEALGAERKSRGHVNRLVITDVNRPQLEQWAADGPVRANGYELFGWDGPVPDELMDDFLDLVLVMNTAPRDDLDINDFTVTPEEMRDFERQEAAMGMERWTLVARRLSDGALAGFHNVTWWPADPTVVNVDSTGVRPEHRGRALGKWLKAAMTLRVLDERPDVTEIRTGNADSNDAMLGINHEMGYRPWIASSSWELPVDRARAGLERRGVLSPG